MLGRGRHGAHHPGSAECGGYSCPFLSLDYGFLKDGAIHDVIEAEADGDKDDNQDLEDGKQTTDVTTEVMSPEVMEGQTQPLEAKKARRGDRALWDRGKLRPFASQWQCRAKVMAVVG